VGGDVLLEPGARRGALNDRRERRLLKAPAVETAEDRRFEARLPCGSESAKLARESGRERLPPGLATLTSPDERPRALRDRALGAGGGRTEPRGAPRGPERNGCCRCAARAADG